MKKSLFCYCLSPILNLYFIWPVFCQNELWIHKYPITTQKPLLTKIDHQTFALSGSACKQGIGCINFTDLYNQEGKKLVQFDWDNYTYDIKQVVLQTMLYDSLLFILFANGKLISINKLTNTVDSSYYNVLGSLREPNARIDKAFAVNEVIYTYGELLKTKCNFHIQYHTRHRAVIYDQPCEAYPLNSIIARLLDGSILATRTENQNTILEKFENSGQNKIFSISIDSLELPQYRLLAYETKSSDLLICYDIESDSMFYTKILRINAIGYLLWSKYIFPGKPNWPYGISYKSYNCAIENPNEEIILGGTEGEFVLGHRGRYLLSKFSKTGTFIWDKYSDVGTEGDEVNSLAFDKYQNLILAGTADISDSELINKIFISKFSTRNFTDPNDKYENIVVYPLPVNQKINVWIQDHHKAPFYLEIIDLTGATIKNETKHTTQFELTLPSTLAKPLFLKIMDSKGIILFLKPLL
ncbi:MAG: hypothetical protein IPM92_07855 [Saprospiraceae bacterium]|nr:hypothetical protein [Saprospiraceae bacterium]